MKFCHLVRILMVTLQVLVKGAMTLCDNVQ